LKDDPFLVEIKETSWFTASNARFRQFRFARQSWVL
jgi:hypothetical protein